MKLWRLSVEMAVVGIAIVIMLLLVNGGNTTDVRMLRNVFLSGALLHLVFEAMGWNEWYVKHYTPLLR